MTGTIYDEIKKNAFTIKKQKMKLVSIVIATNLLVALLCLSLTPASTSTPATSTSIRRLHPHYKMIVVPLNLLIETDPNAIETPVSLMTKSKQILINKAYLHEQVKNDEGNIGRDLGSSAHFKIEIAENDILKLSADADNIMMAIPEIKPPIKEKKLNRRASHYEIDI